MIKVKLSELIDAIEFYSDMSKSFIHLKTGKICFLSEEAINISEDDDPNFSELEEEEIRIAKDYQANPNDFLSLPSQYDVNEYRMMEDFAANLKDEMAGQILISLRGQGAFRRFKDSVILLGIEEDWHTFRNERYKQFVIEWCADNEINLEEQTC